MRLLRWSRDEFPCGDWVLGLKGYWAVTVNGNWRLTFTFEAEDAILVDYQDYH